MAMRERQQMVRVPWPWWEAFLERADKQGECGAEIVREALRLGAYTMNIKLPLIQTQSAAERAAAKLKKAEALVEELRGKVR